MIMIDYDSHTMTYPNRGDSQGATSTTAGAPAFIAAKTEGKVEEDVETTASDVFVRGSARAGTVLLAHRKRDM